MVSQNHFECGICNVRLIHLCHQRSRSFGLFRKTLVGTMRTLARWHSIDGRMDEAPERECRDCVRHMKARLKQKSLAFRCLNRCVNPLFHLLRNRLVTPAELDEARRFARESCRRNLPQESFQLKQ
jgi:hypothetical protein